MAIDLKLIDKLLADYKKPEDIIGEHGLLKQLTKALLERAMQAEMTDHLGYAKHDQAGNNSGNSRVQAVTSDPPAGQNWGPQWGQSFGYDGFGNLLSKTPIKGSATPWNVAVDPATNRIMDSGFQYDANGNLTHTALDNTTYSYDVANRYTADGGYSYNPSNQRVWKLGGGAGGTLCFYGAKGELLGTYAVNNGVATLQRYYVYFGSRQIQDGGTLVATDRLGSVRASGGAINYFPYGEETPAASGQDRFKFGTYYRDSSGLDYARNRYYASQFGRFMTPDPSGMDAASANNPGSWNRYAYTAGDPVNHFDPSSGLEVNPDNCGKDWIWDTSLSGPCGGGDGAPGDGQGGGWGSSCIGNAFNPAPNPACYAPDPVSESPPSKSCSFSLINTGVRGHTLPAHIDTQVDEGTGLINYEAFARPQRN